MIKQSKMCTSAQTEAYLYNAHEIIALFDWQIRKIESKLNFQWNNWQNAPTCKVLI